MPILDKGWYDTMETTTIKIDGTDKSITFALDLTDNIIYAMEDIGGELHPWCAVTKHLPGLILKPNLYFLNGNKDSCSPEIIQWLYNNHCCTKLEVVPCGYCVYDLVSFTPDFINSLYSI